MKKLVAVLSQSVIVGAVVKFLFDLVFWFLEGFASNLHNWADILQFDLLAGWFNSVSYMSDEVGTVTAILYLIFVRK